MVVDIGWVPAAVAPVAAVVADAAAHAGLTSPPTAAEQVKIRVTAFLARGAQGRCPADGGYADLDAS